RSRSRATFCPWSRARFERPGVISRSTCRGRPARTKLARTTAVDSPRCTRAASWGTRWLDRVARYQMASTMLVLPCPFFPTITVMPGRTGSSRRRYERKSVRSSAVSCTEGALPPSDPHRHDQVLVRRIGLALERVLPGHHRRLDRVGEGQAGELGAESTQTVEQEARVEADDEVLALEMSFEHLAGLRVVTGASLERDLALAEGQAHRSVPLGDQGHALDRVDEPGGGDHGGDRRGVREQAPHRRVIAVDQGRRGAATSGLETDEGRARVL